MSNAAPRDDAEPKSSDRPHDELPAYQPSIDTADVFREMIAAELRDGRLTPARRRRIVRYAAQLNLTASEAGRLLAACREEALQGKDPVAKYHALRLVQPQETRVPIGPKIFAVVVLAMLLDLLVWRWLW